MEIVEKIDLLNHRKVDEPVITIYLNTDPSDPDQRGGKWKTTFKNGLHQLETSLNDDKMV